MSVRLRLILERAQSGYRLRDAATGKQGGLRVLIAPASAWIGRPR